MHDGRPVGVAVRPQSLAERFTEAVADCRQAVLEAAFAALLSTDPTMAPLLARFAGVYVFDSTTIARPATFQLLAGPALQPLPSIGTVDQPRLLTDVA